MEVPEPHSNEWTAKRKMSDALRNFIEVILTSNPPADEIENMTEEIQKATDRFSLYRRVYGRREWVDSGELPSFEHAFHETNVLSGASNPIGPPVETWIEGDQFYGKVKVGWAYEGPPNLVHGGIIAAIFDHFLGTSQDFFTGVLGLTKYLNVTYHKPTLVGKELKLVARLKKHEGRKSFIEGEMYDGDTLTASCEVLFIYSDLIKRP